MKKRKRRIIAVLLCWMLCGTTASGAVQEGEVTTTIRSGEVRIRMHRYGDEKKEKGWEDLEHILPGQKITMITEIENLGENCLIRYQMTAEAKSNREIPISSFSGIPGNCVRKGEYFYHTDVVKHGETVRLFTAFTLPETWEQGGEEEIRIHVAADAIQSRNFTPDFTSEHPWGDQVIRKSLRENGRPASDFDTPERNVPGRAGRRRHHNSTGHVFRRVWNTGSRRCHPRRTSDR